VFEKRNVFGSLNLRAAQKPTIQHKLDDNDYVVHTGHVHSSIIKSTVCYKSIRKARALNDYVNAPLLNVTHTT